MRRACARVAKNYSLPELCDGGGEVGGVGRQPQALVFADGVLHTVFGVPELLALGPGQLRLETLQQVVEAPGQDHDVVDVQERHDDEGRVADSCEAEGAKDRASTTTWMRNASLGMVWKSSGPASQARLGGWCLHHPPPPPKVSNRHHCDGLALHCVLCHTPSINRQREMFGCVFLSAAR